MTLRNLEDLPEIMNGTEAASLLGIDRKTLANNREKIPHIKLSERRYLYSKSRLLDWVRNGESGQEEGEKTYFKERKF